MMIDTIALILFIGYLGYWLITRMSKTIDTNQKIYKQKYGILRYDYRNGFDYYYKGA